MFEKREPVVIEVEGKKLFGVWHEPLEWNREKAVLFLHGFGGNKVGKNGLFVSMATKLSKIGIASLRFDFRGAGDSEGEFEEMALSHQLQDALRAFDWIKAPYIAVIGTSMGGLIASLLCARRPVKALALWAPVFDGHQWKKDWQTLPQNQKWIPHKGRMVSRKFFEEFFQISSEEVMLAVERQPFLCIAGDADETLHSTHSEQYKKNGKGAFLTIKGADHNFSGYEERELLQEETLKWLQRVL